MEKTFISIFLTMILLVSICAIQNNNPNLPDQNKEKPIGGDKDEYGCLIAAGYSWNETEKACVREWETGKERYQDQNNYNIGNAGEEKEIQAQNRAENQNEVRGGNYVNENGEQMRIEIKDRERIRLETNGIFAECNNCKMEQETVQNKSKLYVNMSNGKRAEIKIMPNTASERALERLRLKVCQDPCTLELKEVGKSDEEKRMAYEIQIQRHSRILGIFQKKMQIRTQVDAENGEVIQIKKPWWAFIALEPAE